MTSLELVEQKHADAYEAARKLDVNASLVMHKDGTAEIRYCGFVDFWSWGQLTAHLLS